MQDLTDGYCSVAHISVEDSRGEFFEDISHVVLTFPSWPASTYSYPSKQITYVYDEATITPLHWW